MKIEDARGRGEDAGESGYERLFGNHKLGILFSRCHATVISNGNELERILKKKVERQVPTGVVIKGIAIDGLNNDLRTFKDAKVDALGTKHDLRVDVVIQKDNEIQLIELKDGDVFDVKKVAGEVESLKYAKAKLIADKKFSEENIKLYFCSFNATTHEQIESGAKGLLPKGAAMTGKELCAELGVDYNQIVDERLSEQQANLEYFLTTLLEIPEVKKRLKAILGGK